MNKLIFTCLLCCTISSILTLPQSQVPTLIGDLNDSDKAFTEGRSEVSWNPKTANDEPNGRFLLFPWKYLLGNGITYTTTTFQYITSTITSLVISRCIPGSLFKSLGATCRKKRDLESDFSFDDDDQVELSIEETKMIELPPSLSEVRPLEQPEIASSLDEGAIQRLNHRTKRDVFQYVVTLTSTSISYSVTTTTWKNTAVMASTSTILCLPYGYSVC